MVSSGKSVRWSDFFQSRAYPSRIEGGGGEQRLDSDFDVSRLVLSCANLEVNSLTVPSVRSSILLYTHEFEPRNAKVSSSLKREKADLTPGGRS